MTAIIGIAIASIILTIIPKLYFPSGGRGNGFNILGGAWCGTNTLNDAGSILVLVSILVMTWCVPSSGKIYSTLKSPSVEVIFWNLKSRWPFVTMTDAFTSWIWFPSKSWTLK